ncbi:MAG: GAF domain-containing protein [Solirubrobacteraceae bacterium]
MPESQRLRDVELRLAIDQHLDPFAILSAVRDDAGVVTDLAVDFVNQAVCDSLGLTKEQLYARGILAHDPPLVDEATFARYVEVVETGEPLGLDEVELVTWLRGATARVFVDLRVVRHRDGIVLGFRDSTHRHIVRERAEVVTRLYATLSSVNEAIVAAPDRLTLYQRVCDAAVTHGGIRMAWIGEPDPQTGDVSIVAVAGESTSYLDGVQISARDDEYGQGPTGLALREGRDVLAPDIDTDEHMRPWRDRALAHGFRSSAALPFRCGGQVVASMALYGPVPRFFDAAEIALLDQLAANVSFALDAFDQEDRRRAAERELTRTAALLADGEDVAGFGSWEWDVAGDAVTWSPGMCRILDVDERERGGWGALERAFGRARVDRARRGEGPLGDTVRRADGGSVGLAIQFEADDRVLRIEARPLHDPGGRLVRVIGTAQDVTERARAQARAAQLAEERRLLVTEALDAEDRERTRLSERLHDDTLQVLLAAQQELSAAARGDEDALGRARTHVEYAQTSLRELLTDLSPVVYEFSTLSETVRDIARRRLADHAIRAELDLDPSATTPHGRLVARAAGELLSNVVKHASASSVRVALRGSGDEIELCVDDDGAGFEPDLTAAVRGGHIGLASLTSRAAGVGGSLELHPRPGGGTRARLRVPAG